MDSGIFLEEINLLESTIFCFVEWTLIQVSWCRKAVLRSVDNVTIITFLHDFSQNIIAP